MSIPVDGNWSDWVTEGCSEPCDGGVNITTRQCNNPTPAGLGNTCLKSDNRTKGLEEITQTLCNLHLCAGGWV